jgi:repressor LexA
VEATLKRVYKYPSKVVLRPENPMYDDITYANEDMNQIRILGKAVTFMSAVR